MPKKTTSPSVDDEYDMLGDIEHVLKRPATYVGSMNEDTYDTWICNRKKGPTIIKKNIKYIPAFFKIFDEVLVNARDHVTRCRENKSEPCTSIKVNICRETGVITVWNNGAGIPVKMHGKHKMLIPEMLFGHLRSSSNFDDSKKRTTGGVNGLGAKLANIYSTKFEVETLDAIEGKKFYQCFQQNMTVASKPKVTSATNKKPYTKFTFIPDFEQFKMKEISKDVEMLFKKRVYDIAMNSGINVYYNDEKITINKFEKYIDCYFPDGSGHKKILDLTNKNWRIAVVYDPESKFTHKNISFVNGIATTRGGTHVKHVVEQVVKKIRESVTKKVKDAVIKPEMIKESLIFFIDCTIVNPDFDTQTKEFMTNKVETFGSKYSPPDVFLNKILKTGVVNKIIEEAEMKAQAALSKSLKGKRLEYEKLEDAHDAEKRTNDCTLFLTEGDSAATLAREGVSVLGKQKYGIFPLRGKFINVRDKSSSSVSENKEAEALARIIGLEHGKEYNNTKSLRYSKIVVFTDQDLDGFHIKGLVINYIHRYWPSLLKLDFIQSFATPVLKAIKGKKTIPFYSLQEFDEWEKNNKGWKVKYYKGLGTSSKAEAREYFARFHERLVSYKWEGIRDKSQYDEDTPYIPRNKDLCQDSIILCFDKERADDRKDWLKLYNPKVYIDSAQTEVPFHDFINKELLAYSVHSVERAVPSIVDGLKPGQRKILAACFKRNLKESVKVSQLVGYIGENMEYHHGEKALQDTIVGMAQNYVGSNNINLLFPDGQFGSRFYGGNDAASARYIFTRLEKLTRAIFRSEDEGILEKQYEDNHEIEPVYYAPIIPMIIVNDVAGIGTGYATKIPPTNPAWLIENCKRYNRGEKLKKMIPWYKNYSGVIEEVEDKGTRYYVCHGTYHVNGDTLTITELPIGVWSSGYQEFLNGIITKGLEDRSVSRSEEKNKKAGKGKKVGGSKTSATKTPAKKKGKGKGKGKGKVTKVVGIRSARKIPIAKDIKSFISDCTNDKVLFTIKFYPGTLAKYVDNGTLEKDLKLTVNINLTNMHAFNSNRIITRYESYSEILKEFANVRLELYGKRKEHLLKLWKADADILSWKIKFMDAVISNEIQIFRKKEDEVVGILEENGYPKLGGDGEKTVSYNYLTKISIISFTKDKVAKLRKQLEEKNNDIDILKNKTVNDIWLEELDELEAAYNEWIAEEIANHAKESTTQKKKKGTKAK
jgi:DNA topoisomerase II